MLSIIPKPNGPVAVHAGHLTLPDQPAVELGGFSEWCVQAFFERIGCTLREGGRTWLTLVREEMLGAEGYRLRVTAEGVTIHAAEETGVVWALASLVQLLDEKQTLPLCEIKDQPKYGHRGLNLDCARHYFPVDTVKLVIDQISLTKLNVLHWHLADDQSWRIESKRFPRLQETSGQYYTQEEIREIVEYARVRGVDVVPEIDMPGHTSGILAAYPEYSCSGRNVQLATSGGIFPIILCAGKDSVFEFIGQLLDEICPLFPSKRFHVGGDEAPKSEWTKCPHCQKRMEQEGIANVEDLQGYFTGRVAQMLASHGKQIICWNDSLLAANLPEGIQVQDWTLQYMEPTRKFVEAGGSFIYSDMFELYLDYPHSMTPLKRVYECEPHIGRLKCADAPGLLGMEACLWTEHITEPKQLGKRLFPRIFALAEVAWTWERDYGSFQKRLIPHVIRTEHAGAVCTLSNWWDPKGKSRREEALAYVEKMFSGMSADVQQETTGNVSINMAFILGFVTKFFKMSDLPYLAKILKK